MSQGFSGSHGHANGPHRDARAGSGRGRSVQSPPGQVPHSPAPLSSATNLSRAERFEDEKRRIVNSCFSKEATPGQFEESYITHIRIQEDAAFPQSPPPPNSPPGNKKPRIIIVAVRSTGRVRLHKARENGNGSFSIGKTWNMEDLGGIQSYKNLVVSNTEERQQKQWAGDVGFLVTVGKAYYWQAATPKEKDFFIASLVKIFRKYTQGQAPELKGFGPQELDQLLGPSGQYSTNNQPRPLQQPSRNALPSSGSSIARAPLTPPERLNNRPGPGNPPSINHRRSPSDYSFAPRVDQSSSHPLPLPPQPNELHRPSHSHYSDERVGSHKSNIDSNRSRSRERRKFEPVKSPTPHLPTLDALIGNSSSEHLGPAHTVSTGSNPSTGHSVNQRRSSPRAHVNDSRQRPEYGHNDQSLENSIVERGYNNSYRPNGTYNDGKRDLSPGGLRPGTGKSENSSMTSRSDDRQGRSDRRPAYQLGHKSNDSQRSLSDRAQDTTPYIVDENKYQRSRSRPRQTPAEAFTFPSRSKTPVGIDASPLASRSGNVSVSPDLEIKEEPPKGTQDLENVVSPVAEIKLQEEEEDFHKPGLGPMIKKRSKQDTANTFRKATTALNAFRPRAGGAGSKLLSKEEKASTELNGVTGVFPAPRLLRVMSDDSNASSEGLVSSKPSFDSQPSKIPQLSLSRAESREDIARRTRPTSPAGVKQEMAASAEIGVSSKVPDVEGKSKKRRSYQQTKELAAMGVDPLLLEGRCLDFESVLGEFGWTNSSRQPTKVDVLEADMRRALGRVEAGSWLGNMQHKDGRVEAVERMLDKAIAECEDLEGLLTLYSVELSSLNEDVAYIEAQSHGLQVQTANQKLLQSELHSLLETISIDPRHLTPLRRASLASTDGIETIESCLLRLYNSLTTIDPAIKQSSGSKAFQSTPISEQAIELSSMRAVQERKEAYVGESMLFLDLFQQHMDVTFAHALRGIEDLIDRRMGNSSAAATGIDVGVYDTVRTSLWIYSPLVLFAKEVSNSAWMTILQNYQSRAHNVYVKDMEGNPNAWMALARKPTGEEDDILFSSYYEKDADTLSARKLTVKRSQTLARSLRSAASEKIPTVDKSQAGKLHPAEAFANSLDETAAIIFREHNFVVDFFHASSISTADFVDAIKVPPERRKGTDLSQRKPLEADRAIANQVREILDGIFEFWPRSLRAMIRKTTQYDRLQAIGVMAAIERKLSSLEDSNQDFLIRSLQNLHEPLVVEFDKFVDEQVHAIEETKVKIKRRKGVTPFIKNFPNFSAMVESMLPSDDDIGSMTESTGSVQPASQKLAIRESIDSGYHRINKAMFESVKAIARDSPASGGSGAVSGAGAGAGTGTGRSAAAITNLSTATGDPEDKAALKYHILIIENMNHYVEEVDEQGASVLRDWKAKAVAEMTEHLHLYLGAVIRRPLGKLLDFLESTESLIASAESKNEPASTISTRQSHSRSVFKKIIAAHDTRELRRGIDAIKKRISKHFGEADDVAALSRGLVTKVLRECEKKYVEVWERAKRITDEVYPGGGVELEWRKEDVGAVFRR